MLTTLALAVVAVPALAGGPAGTFLPWGSGFVCSVGPNDGDTCIHFEDCCPEPGACPPSYGDPPKANPCKPDFVPNKVLSGTLTLVVDDDVKDWWNQTLFAPPRGSLTVLLEVRKSSQVHVFAETYESISDGGPPLIGIQAFDSLTFAPVAEIILADDDLDPAATCTWLAAYRQPEPLMAQELVELAGIAGVARPVIVKAVPKGPTKTLDHIEDELGSAVRCRVTIKFLDAPIIAPTP